MNTNPFDTSPRCSDALALTIRPGDMVKVAYGVNAGNTVIIIARVADSRVFAPVCRYEGNAINFQTDMGRVGHYMLTEDAIAVRQWIPEGEVAAEFAR